MFLLAVGVNLRIYLFHAQIVATPLRNSIANLIQQGSAFHASEHIYDKHKIPTTT
jgi:hypothetical protein